MQLIVFEDSGFRNLLPLTFSRATFNLRCGLDNLLAKIEAATQTAEAVFVRPQIAGVMAERQTRRVNQPATSDDQLFVNGRVLARRKFEIPEGAAVWQGDSLVAARMSRAIACKLSPEAMLEPRKLKESLGSLTNATLPTEDALLVEYPWQLIRENANELARQCGNLKFSLAGQIDSRAHLINEKAIQVGEGSRLKPGAVLDAEEGPIYIGENVTVHSNAVIVGPCFVGDGCIIRPGSSVAGSSIGMVCKIGGEVEGTIFHGYSNKQHDGFIGHSYVGEWVNLGADTVGSDLKNTYGPVRVPINGREIDSGEQFLGAFIGDHTKTAIGTKLPTGCVIGYGCNIACGGFVPKFVPSFSWVTDKGIEGNDPQRALSVAHAVVGRRNRKYSRKEEALFLSIAGEAKQFEYPVGPE